MATAPKNSVSNSGATMSFVQNLFQAGMYKRNQGRIARQVTFAAIAITVLIGAWRMNVAAEGSEMLFRFGLPALVLCAGIWIAYRVVNLANFADFLISVEAEMSKVSWPSRTELVRGSIVVLITILFLAGFLFVFDLIWTFVFKQLGIVG